MNLKQVQDIGGVLGEIMREISETIPEVRLKRSRKIPLKEFLVKPLKESVKKI